MLHKKIAATSIGKVLTFVPNVSPDTTNTTPLLTLVQPGSRPIASVSSARLELFTVSAQRCSTFLAEAAVLVLVFALLDRLMLKDKMEFSWAASAFGISLTLLAGSIAIDCAISRWLTPS